MNKSYVFFFSLFISIEYSTSLIIKRQILDAKRRELFRCDSAFENEIAAYTYLIPVLKKFSNDNLPYPNCLFAGSDGAGEEIIAMEDLTQDGYRMANRIQGLDFEHCSLVLKVKVQTFVVEFMNKFYNFIIGTRKPPRNFPRNENC